MAAPRDNRIGSVEAEKKKAALKKRVKVKRARKPSVGDKPSERPDQRLRNFSTGEPVTHTDLGGIGRAAKPVGEWLVEQALGGQAAKRPGSSSAVRAANDPRVRGASAGARTAFDIVQGPETRKLLQGARYSPWMAGIEMGALLPLAKPLRGTRAAQKGVREALKKGSVEAGYQAAEGVYEGASVAKKTLQKVPSRKRALNESVQEIAAARSRTGRVVEKGIDKARSRVRIPFVKSPEQVWARDAERRIVHDSKVAALPGVLADRSIKHLNRPQKYALYALGTETSPEQWIEFYTRQIQVETDPLVKAAMKTHVANFAKARKYVTLQGDEIVTTGARGEDKLLRAYAHLQGSSEAREQILARGGYLDPDTIVARRSAPGRIARGAQWTPEETHAWNVIRESPSRQQLRAAMERSGIDPQDVEAQLMVMDTQVRSFFEHETNTLRKQEKTLTRKIEDILEKEAEGEEIDEVALRTLEDELAVVQDKMGSTTYDELYKRLATAQHGFPPNLAQAVREQFPGENVSLQRAGASADDVVPPRRTIDPKVTKADQAFATNLAAELATTLGRKTKIDQAGLEAGIFRAIQFARLGEDGKLWYEESAQRILAATGGNKVEAERIAQLIGLLSASTEVGDNVGRAFKAYKQWKAGEAISIRKDMDDKIRAILDGKPWEGRKTNTFYRNMLEDIDPEKHAEMVREAGEGFDDVTVDRHIYATFGLPAGSSAYYDVVQNAYRAIQRELGWEKPKQVQAASWVIEKFHNVKNRYPKWSDERAWADATKNYSDAMNTPVYTTRFPIEARPGSADVIPEYASWSPEVQAAHLAAKVPAVNQYFAELGLPFTIREIPGPGYWMKDGVLQVNPAIAIDVHSGGFLSDAEMGKLAQAGKDIELSDDERAIWDAAAAGLAVAMRQDAASWFRPLRAGRKSQQTLAHLRLGRGGTKDDIAVLVAKFGEDDAWFSHAADGLYVAHNPYGNLGIPEYQRLVAEVESELGADGVWYAHQSGYLEGEDLANAVTDRGRVEGVAGAADRLRQASDEVDAAFRADPEGAAAQARGQVDAPGRDVPEGTGGAWQAASGGDSGLGAGAPIPRRRADAIPRTNEQELAAWREPVTGDTHLIHGAHIPLGGQSGVFVSDKSLHPSETWSHELAHFWQEHMPGVEKRLERMLGPNKEDWVEAWQEYVLDLYPQRSIPRGVRDAFDTLSGAILKEADRTGGARFVAQGMPRQVAELFDTTLWYKHLDGGVLRGAEDFTGGIYTAVERGFPVSLRHPLAASRHRLQSLSGLFQGRTGIKGGFKDPTVKKHFTGRSVESGWIKIANVGRSQYNALLKAIRMENVQVARMELLKASTDTPTAYDDIAVFVNPSQKAPPELKRFWEAAQEMEHGLDVNKLSLKEVDELDEETLERIHKSAFPAELDGKPSRAVAQEIIDGVHGPIDGVRWVSAEAFHASDLFSAPTAFFNRTNSWGKLEAGGKLIDTVNDLMKLSLLPLNPAYAPMNLAGNLMLNLLQQGPFAIMNLPRAALLSRELGQDAATAIDYHMGRGIMHLGETEVLAQNYSATLSNWLGAVIDVVPRRAAFLHEAWSMGFKSADDIDQLLRSDAFRDELYEIVQRANDAIIDYERLSPFERKYLQRILFIYPWIRGATRYTYRFPMEHPIQAMAFALAYERQQAMADEQLGERPWYAEFNIPIGEVERFGQKYPLTLNPKQLLPFTTPVEMANVLTAWASGNDVSQAPIDLLQPFWPALVTSITGYDTFAQREVGRGPGTFLSQVSNFPLRTAIENIGKSDAQLEEASSNRLYPRNHTDELLKIGLGSLAPTPYNAEKGEFYSEGKRGQTPEEKARQKFDEVKEFIPPGREQWVQEALQTKVEWAHKQDEGRKRFKTDNLTPQQQATLMVELGAKYIPYLAEHEREVKDRIDAETAGPIRSEIEGDLGWNDIDELTGYANEKKRADEARAEGAVASANR